MDRFYDFTGKKCEKLLGTQAILKSLFFTIFQEIVYSVEILAIIDLQKVEICEITLYYGKVV